MIPVQVGNKNMADPGGIEPVPAHLYLSAFPAINQKKPLIHIQQMSGRKTF